MATNDHAQQGFDGIQERAQKDPGFIEEIVDYFHRDDRWDNSPLTKVSTAA